MVLSQAKGMSFFFFLKSDKAATVNDALFPKKKLYLGLMSISRVNKMETLLQLSQGTLCYFQLSLLFLYVLIKSIFMSKPEVNTECLLRSLSPFVGFLTLYSGMSMISVSYQLTHFNPWQNLTIKTKQRLGFYLERTLAYYKEEPDSQTSSFSHFITYLIRHYSYGKENALTPLVKMVKRGKENNNFKPKLLKFCQYSGYRSILTLRYTTQKELSVVQGET